MTPDRFRLVVDGSPHSKPRTLSLTRTRKPQSRRPQDDDQTQEWTAVTKASMPAAVTVPTLSVPRKDLSCGISESCQRFVIRGSSLCGRLREHVPQRSRAGRTIGRNEHI
jgi:hypothetical protein